MQNRPFFIGILQKIGHEIDHGIGLFRIRTFNCLSGILIFAKEKTIYFCIPRLET